MARQPIKFITTNTSSLSSASKATTKLTFQRTRIRKFSYPFTIKNLKLLFYAYLSVTFTVISCNDNLSNNNYNNSDNDLININNSLKFGDRLSPRMRSYTTSSTNSKSSQKTNINSTIIKETSGSKHLNVNNSTNSIQDTINNGNFLNDNDLAFNDNDINRNDYISTDSDYANNDYFTIMHNKHHNNLFIENDAKKNTTIVPPLIRENPKTGSGETIKTSSHAQAHRLEMSTEFFVVPPTQLSSIYSTKAEYSGTTQRPKGVVLATKNLLQNTTIQHSPNTTSTYKKINDSGLRKEPWVVPVLVLSMLSMLMMAAFEIFVLCKTRRTSPNRRHLFLGQMLLLGLFSCSGLSAILTAKPTTLSCGTIRFGAGVSFALVFASLLVKCIFLISLNGGVYLPAPYQGLLLLFAVLIQVTIDIQWLITSPPGINLISTSEVPLTSRQYLVWTAEDLNSLKFTIQLCKTPFSEFLLSLIYVGCLIIFVTILAIKSRGIRDNYREATYIGLAIGGTIPIWLGWTLCGMAVSERHRDACLAFGLVATSSIIFLVMFMPKGRQLAAMGREDLYNEDREERFSASSRAGSGYSPSFFHFKPIKYGVMGQKSNQNVNNSSNSKHQQVATLGGGESFNFFLTFFCLIYMHRYGMFNFFTFGFIEF